VRTWLLVAAERREFEGILRRAGTPGVKLEWPGAKFARELEWKGDRWWLIANGPGERLVEEALATRRNVDGIVSIGFCGALDPALRIGDIVVSEDTPVSGNGCVRGPVFSSGSVAVTAREKHALRNQTGAIAVDMEAAAVQRKARLWGVPFRCIRAVSDTAGEDLPLNFNRFRNRRGDFSRTGIAVAAMLRPFTVMPRLLQFDRNCRRAALALGDFLAEYQF
jgi:adenosylhomocysteine nucleosidase